MQSNRSFCEKGGPIHHISVLVSTIVLVLVSMASYRSTSTLDGSNIGQAHAAARKSQIRMRKPL